MYGKNAKQLRVRLFISLTIAFLFAIVMVAASVMDGGAGVGEIILMLLLSLPIFFFEIFGIFIAPKLYFEYLKSCFHGVAITAFVSIFWGLIKVFFSGFVWAIKSFIIGIQGTAFVIKHRNEI